MDMKNDAMIPPYGNLAAGPFVVGAKQLRKAITSGRAGYVYLATNADPAVTDPLITLCQNYGVAYEMSATMQQLGKACGIEVGAAAACSLKEN